LITKKDTKFLSVCFWTLISGNSKNSVWKTKSEPGVLLEFLQGAREGSRVGKVKLLFFFLNYTHENDISWKEINTFKFLFHKLKFDDLKILIKCELQGFLLQLSILNDKTSF